MSTTLDLSLRWSAIAQVVIGALLGATAAIVVQRALASRFGLAAFNIVVCVGAGALTMTTLRWPHVSMLVAFGLVGAAAPITLALGPTPSLRTPGDAGRYLRRAAASLTMHVLYSVGFAALGFAVSLLVWLLVST